MKRFIAPAAAALVLSLAPAAVAQVDQSGSGDEVEMPESLDGTSGTGRTPGEGRIPGEGRTAGEPREPGTGRTAGEPGTPRSGGSPQSLPATGLAGDLAIDGAALLGAGLVLLRTRRRITS